MLRFLLYGDGRTLALGFYICPSLSSPSMHDHLIPLCTTVELPCTAIPASVRYRLLCSPPALEPLTLDMIDISFKQQEEKKKNREKILSFYLFLCASQPSNLQGERQLLCLCSELLSIGDGPLYSSVANTL